MREKREEKRGARDTDDSLLIALVRSRARANSSSDANQHRRYLYERAHPIERGGSRLPSGTILGAKSGGRGGADDDAAAGDLAAAAARLRLRLPRRWRTVRGRRALGREAGVASILADGPAAVLLARCRAAGARRQAGAPLGALRVLGRRGGHPERERLRGLASNRRVNRPSGHASVSRRGHVARASLFIGPRAPSCVSQRARAIPGFTAEEEVSPDERSHRRS